MSDDPRALYNNQADRWVRKAPTSLSDFTARPAVIELCEPIKSCSVLDLGCGEGYCSRQLKLRGAASILGIDLSDAMIEAARGEESREPLGITYQQGDASALQSMQDASFDRILAVFLFNYTTLEQTGRCLQHVRRLLKPGGRFVFAVPHPSFAFMRQESPPFYFSVQGNTYFGGRDQRFPGRIWKRDGVPLEVQMVHKTLQDYFELLAAAGFKTMPKLRELRVLKEHLELDPAFFGPLEGWPLHLACVLDID
jgi:ubiquinone/menaquinone biosynthesis C-methylase UbiE